MISSTQLFIPILFFLAALLYSSVGHAGASGYLSIMALFGFAPASMRPTALTLNILVAVIATYKFYRSGNFSWSIFWPFALGSIPFAFIGGSITFPSHIYKVIVGLILLYSAYRLFLIKMIDQTMEAKRFPVWLGIVSGIVIGFLSGLTGVGGGIFLSPLLIFMGWAETRLTAGVSAAFILVNSIAGLLGNPSSVSNLPATLPILAIAVVIGGYIGAKYGSKRFDNITLRRLLALVLVIAGLKLIFT